MAAQVPSLQGITLIVGDLETARSNHRPWGARGAQLADPDGQMLTFKTRRRDASRGHTALEMAQTSREN